MLEFLFFIMGMENDSSIEDLFTKNCNNFSEMFERNEIRDHEIRDSDSYKELVEQNEIIGDKALVYAIKIQSPFCVDYVIQKA